MWKYKSGSIVVIIVVVIPDFWGFTILESFGKENKLCLGVPREFQTCIDLLEGGSCREDDTMCASISNSSPKRDSLKNCGIY